VGTQGSATFSNGSFTVSGAGSGAGNGTGGTTDQFHFVYQSLSGDGSIIARVSNIQGGSSHQVGVMIRESLDAGATDAFAYFQPNTADLQNRASAGASPSYITTSFAAPSYPFWLRLDRSDSTFTGYISLDGVYWTPMSSTASVTMAVDAYVGLAVSSTSTSSLVTATFDNVSVSSTTSPAPTITSVSATTGSVGSQVVIYGKGFGQSQGNSFVYLNGTPVTINSWSDTSITITIPSAATSGLLGVSVAPSMNNSNTVVFTVTTQPLATMWLDVDIGNFGLAGSATYSNGTFTINGAGSGIQGTTDAMHFVYQPLSGDGSIVARVSSYTGSFPQIGVMIRESLHTDATNAFAYFVPNTAALFYRTTTSGNTSSQSVSFAAAKYPYWVKLTRASNVFTGYVSLDGVNWTQIGASQTITMVQNVFIGMAVTSQSTTSLATASFDSVSIASDVLTPPVITAVSATTGTVGSQVSIFGNNFGASQGSSTVVLNGSPVTVGSWSPTAIGITIPTGATSGYLEVLVGPSLNSSNPVVFTVTTQPLPTGWLDTDIGATGLAGSTTYSGGTFTVKAAGQGISGTSDGMHFVYQPLSGDGLIVARVSNVQGGSSNTQIGAMIRETLNPAASDAFVDFYPNSASITERTSTGASAGTQYTSFGAPAVPYWVKLARTGSTFNAYISLDSVTWTQVGTSQTINMAQTAYIGLGVSNQSTTSLATATFDNVAITLGTMPIVLGLTPASGGIAASVTITGTNFGSSQGTSTVKFNGASATSFTSWSNTQIVAAVPTNASTGPVTVTVNAIQSNNNFGFTFYNPVITSLSPPAGQVGATVVVSGTGFGVDQGDQVLFNGLAAGILNWSDTSITIGVPPLATSGPVMVIKGGVASNSITFAVETLGVTGISPILGPQGTLVTISGSGFGASQSNSIVDFFGTSATIQSWSDTQIVAVVPLEAASGPVDVTVGSLVWHGPTFTITKSIQTTDSQSNPSSYTSANIGGVWVPLTTQGSGCSTCTIRGNINYTYSDDALSTGDKAPLARVASRTDENGNTTSYTYDHNGNVLTGCGKKC
jgi:regulation of enolase protein 1 (concanavalin A-like superfamily)